MRAPPVRVPTLTRRRRPPPPRHRQRRRSRRRAPRRRGGARRRLARRWTGRSKSSGWSVTPCGLWLLRASCFSAVCASASGASPKVHPSPRQHRQPGLPPCPMPPTPMVGPGGPTTSTMALRLRRPPAKQRAPSAAPPEAADAARQRWRLPPPRSRPPPPLAPKTGCRKTTG
ncbi:hypothetical protein BU14_0332s0018 [Porphyra umbilicalis]|uniref:Uncharacterized protein n=1 Tax=Porphyra umbilicalis TaxID=2786 RepID=A0A1X6NYU0_PORUM|nr:hypothetical protein BU14_0332s0018 [Porphyra umbilicalis]|eukprot:OSX73666.1 hypothetical protein BU14_0332s0018 [Porphyra umbilicalis]